MDPETGRSEVVSIMAAADELSSRERCQELELWAQDIMRREWEKPAKPHSTKEDRLELSGSLKEVVASNRRRYTQMADKNYELGGYLSGQ